MNLQADEINDVSEMYFDLINNMLLPKISVIFEDYTDYVSPSEYTKPTEHLATRLRETNPDIQYFQLLEDGYNQIYRVCIIPETNYQITLTLNQRSFSLSTVPLDNYYNTTRTNNLSLSPDRNKKMYIYGVKANGDGPRIRGNVLNRVAFMICEAMHIPELYISDSAGVACYWDPDIELEHFSILRVIAGKTTFYESLPGHFLKVEEAMREKEKLQSEISTSDKLYVLQYLESLQHNSAPQIGENCSKIKEIIRMAIHMLPKHPAIFQYVATPYRSMHLERDVSGRRNRKRLTSKSLRQRGTRTKRFIRRRVITKSRRKRRSRFSNKQKRN
jgi:hypothetical protein